MRKENFPNPNPRAHAPKLGILVCCVSRFFEISKFGVGRSNKRAWIVLTHIQVVCFVGIALLKAVTNSSCSIWQILSRLSRISDVSRSVVCIPTSAHREDCLSLPARAPRADKCGTPPCFSFVHLVHRTSVFGCVVKCVEQTMSCFRHHVSLSLSSVKSNMRVTNGRRLPTFKKTKINSSNSSCS